MTGREGRIDWRVMKWAFYGGILLAAGSGLGGSVVETVTELVVAPFREPEVQTWGATASFGDSDEDAFYSVHRGWYRPLGEGSLDYGWEVGGGLAHSGKRSNDGAFAYLDLLLKGEIVQFGRLTGELVGLAGVQLQTLRMPGRTHNNFRLGAFVDWTIEAGERDWFLRTGYLHASNANVGGGNEGHDAWWAGLGFSW